MKLLGHRRAAHHIAAFEDAHLEASARQIEGADEAVVAAADDYGIVRFCHSVSVRLERSREALARTCLDFARHERQVVPRSGRSEEHTSELQSLMRISYAVFCLK